MLALAGDIGGTKTLLQLAQSDGHAPQIIAEQEFVSQDHPDFIAMVQEFLATSESGIPDSACFAVAGPVRNQRSKVTWLPWELDAQLLSNTLSIARVQLINDFEGVGYGIEALQPGDLVTLQTGNPEQHGTRAIIGAGTGLGGGILAWQNGHYQMITSEIGHSDFAPGNEIGVELMHYLLQDNDRVSCEQVISGKGIVNIFAFLQHHTGKTASSDLQQAMQAGDAAAAISQFALKQKDSLAIETLELFIQCYGTIAGNLALICKASGGMFIAGGIAAKIVDAMKSPSFLDAFNNKPPMQKLLTEIPVHVVTNQKVGLLGAMEIAKSQ